MLVILIPGLKIIPALYRWKVNLGIYRWVSLRLLGIEQELLDEVTPEKHRELQERLDHIERVVDAMRVPGLIRGSPFYFLRGHIGFCGVSD